jgi:hypothetical protein
MCAPLKEKTERKKDRGEEKSAQDLRELEGASAKGGKALLKITWISLFFS